MGDFDHSTQLQHLLERLQQGDPTAREQLIQRALERLGRLTRRMFRRHPDLRALEQTDDVLQKALIRLHRALRNIHPPQVRPFFGLAAQQVRWVLKDLAAEWNRAKVVQPVGEMASTVHKESPLDPADWTREPSTLGQWTEFHEQVDALPAEDRELFDLLWYQGLSQPEAAELLGMSLRTLKRRWLAARLRLRHRLHDDPPGR